MSFGSPSYLRRGSTFAGEDGETLDMLIDLAAQIWDEYGDEIIAWVREKGIPWTIDKVKSIIRKKTEKAGATPYAVQVLIDFLHGQQAKNYEKARAAIFAALQNGKAQGATSLAARHGEKFTVSNVFAPSGSAGDSSDWLSSVFALAAGAGVAWAAVSAYKKYWRRS